MPVAEVVITAEIPIVILAGDSWCTDCGLDLWDGHEAGLATDGNDRPITVCMVCRLQRIREGDI